MTPPEHGPVWRGRRSFLAAMVIDALGSGVFLPFVLLYFVRVDGIALSALGTVIALANLALIPLSTLLGRLVDRLRPLRALIAGNLVRAAAYLGFALVTRPAAVLALVAVTVALDKVSWISQGAAIGQVVRGARSQTLYGAVNWARNVGLGLGSLLGGLAAAGGGRGAYQALAVANAVSFAAAAWLLLRSDPPRKDVPASAPERGFPRDLWRDHRFLSLVVAKTCFATCATAVSTFLAYYLVTVAHAPAWGLGLPLTLNCALVVAVQRPATRRMLTVPRHRQLSGGGIAYLAAGAGFALTALGPPGAVVFVACAAMVVYTLGEIVIAPGSDSLAAEIAPPARLGQWLAVYQAGWSIAAVAVPGPGALLLRSAPGWFWPAFAVVAAVGAVSGRRAGRRGPVPAAVSRPRPTPGR